MPIEQRDNFGVVGLPNKWTDTVAKELENLVTGSFPEVSGMDFTAGPSTTLRALTVVAMSGKGQIVEAQANFIQPGAVATGSFTATGSAGSAVTIDSVPYSVPTATGNVNARAAALAVLINDDATGAVFASAASAVVTVYARAPGTSGNGITVTAGTGVGSASNTSGGTGGNVPLGILVEDLATDSSTKHQAGVYLTGVFNPDRLAWHSSFTGDVQKRMAFANARSLTQITLRSIRANTVT